MMTITPMTIGGVEYLLAAQACAEHEHGVEAELGDGAGYYVATERTGEAPAVLRGEAVSRVGLQSGSHPTETQARALLACQDPHSGEWLGRPIPQARSRDERMREALATLSPQATEEEKRDAVRRIDNRTQQGRAFYDITLSPDKSISALYAAYRTAGEHELADAVLASHNEAVDEAMRYLEERTWTRTGRHTSTGSGQTTGQFEHVGQLVRLDFQHTTSRATDPHLHTHSAVLNRVPCEDGQWRAVHGQAWRQAKPAAAARYENRLAELIEERTPARFVSRDDGHGRQVAGIDPQVLDESSQRTRQVLDAQNAALAEFRSTHGREPEPSELRQIHRTAGLESRDPKSGRSPSELLAAWSEREGIDAGKIVRQVHETGEQRDFWGQQSAPRTDREIVREAVSELQHAEAHWTTSLLSAYIAARLPLGITSRADELAEQATSAGNPFGIVDLTRRDPGRGPVPEKLRNEFGYAAWRDPSLGSHALSTHLADEAALASEAAQETMPALDEQQLAEVEARWAEDGVTLNTAQRAAVLGILGSARQGDAVVAAAGAGKSHMAGILTDEWHRRGGTVHGVTTSQIAAHVLVEHGLTAMNSTRWLMAYEPEAPAAGGARLTPGDCVVVDEANMSSTAELRRIQRVCARDGAKVIFVGDPAQLSAVGAGGGLDELARTNGAHDLPEPLRFHAEWEREASQRLRAGDAAAVDDYLAQGRIHGGTQEAMRAAAVDRYAADRLRGESSLLITGTNGEAAEVAEQVQQRLMQLGELDPSATPYAADMNGANVYQGDRIQWRHNVYDVDADDGRAVVNREYLTVAGVDDRGRVRLERESGTDVFVPAGWLSEWAQLGYAVTEHGAEGVTVDNGHALTAGYVAMTRGRSTNEAWLTTAAEADAHEPELDSSAREQFTEALSEAGRTRSALQHWREELDAGRSTATLSAIWEQSTRAAVDERTRAALATHMAGDDLDLTSESVGELTATLTRAELSGHASDDVLAETLDAGPLDDARDVPAVLAARAERVLRRREPDRPTGTWTQRAAGLHDRHDASELGRFTYEVGRALDMREAELADRLADDPPMWATRQLGPLPPVEQADERDRWLARAGRIAAWRERAGVADSVPSIGPRPREDDVHERIAWEDAARACGRDVDLDAYLDAPDTDLEAHRARWRRVCEQAPVYVADELARAREAQTAAEADATLLDRQAELADDAGQAERAESLRRSATAQRDAAAVTAERAAVLADAQEARDDWQALHQAEQDRALAAERELRRRGRLPDQPTMEPEPAPEQGVLFEVTNDRDDEPARELAGDEQRQEQAEHELDDDQQPLEVDVEPDTAQRAREQQLVEDRSVDEEADRETSTLVAEREQLADAADAGRTVREVETQARWAREIADRRRQEQAERQEQREAERAERDRREQPETAVELDEREIPLPEEEPDRDDEPDLEL